MLGFDFISTLWDERGFEVCVICAIIFIIAVSIYNYSSGGKKSRQQRRKKAVGSEGSSYFPSPFGDKFCSKLELRCKFICENLFQKPFDKIRPEWLTNNVTGKPLEIDLYNDQLKLGIECQGKQHYVHTPFFQKNKSDFRDQQYRDEIKRLLCEKHGITLIEIPYNLPESSIESFIKSQLILKQYKL